MIDDEWVTSLLFSVSVRSSCCRQPERKRLMTTVLNVYNSIHAVYNILSHIQRTASLGHSSKLIYNKVLLRFSFRSTYIHSIFFFLLFFLFYFLLFLVLLCCRSLYQVCRLSSFHFSHLFSYRVWSKMVLFACFSFFTRLGGRRWSGDDWCRCSSRNWSRCSNGSRCGGRFNFTFQEIPGLFRGVESRC